MNAFRRAVVTGGAGFLGSHLCEALMASGTAVTCVDDLSTGTARNVEELRASPLFEMSEQDITEPGGADYECDLVVHMASPASPREYLDRPLETLKAGSHGTLWALELAEAHHARFLLASTSEVYGDPLEHPQRESYWGNVNPVGPRSVYDEAKRYAEALTTAYRDHRGLGTRIARIFNTYGPKMRVDDGRMVPTFACQALRGEPLTITGSGEQTRSLCYVDDTVRGLLALARSDWDAPVNIGNPVELRVNAIAGLIRELTSSTSGIEHIDAMTDDPSRRCPDITTAREHLGWEPSVPAEQGLRTTLLWFARNVTPARVKAG